jgi:hypothetical protein
LSELEKAARRALLALVVGDRAEQRDAAEALRAAIEAVAVERVVEKITRGVWGDE